MSNGDSLVQFLKSILPKTTVSPRGTRRHTKLRVPKGLEEDPHLQWMTSWLVRVPRLSASAQRRLKRQMEQGDSAAFRRLITTGLPWVFNAAARYVQRRADLNEEFFDLFQEGVLGLAEGIKRWDPERAPLAAFSSLWIRRYLQMYELYGGTVVRLPLYLYQDRERLLRGIKTDADAKRERLHRLLPPVSLNADLSQYRDSATPEQWDLPRVAPLPEGHFHYEDIEDPRDLAELVVESVYRQQVRVWLAEQSLSDREVLVIRWRMGFEGRRWTLEEIGRSLGVTRERVRQIEKKAIERLRARATALCP